MNPPDAGVAPSTRCGQIEPANPAARAARTIEAGHAAIRFLALSDQQKATLRANFIKHRSYPYGVKASVFRDVPEVAVVFGMPALEAPLQAPQKRGAE